MSKRYTLLLLGRRCNALALCRLLECSWATLLAAHGYTLIMSGPHRQGLCSLQAQL